MKKNSLILHVLLESHIEDNESMLHPC
jgi:hypothetical protein